MCSKNKQRQFNGYFHTPPLWKGEWNGLKQLELSPIPQPSYNSELGKKLRLGHLVETYVAYELEQHKEIKVIAKNLQIIREKQTLGEFDFILKQGSEVKQIEVSYKFYFYDPSIIGSELARWIGPNRKDSFLQKISKIKDRQFPLLQEKETYIALEKLRINLHEVQQNVLFKGQLFVPLKTEVDVAPLNPDNVVGIYINLDEIDRFKDDKFIIPNKHEWLIKPHENVAWKSLNEIREALTESIKEERSVLVWHKSSKGVLTKMFIVWW